MKRITILIIALSIAAALFWQPAPSAGSSKPPVGGGPPGATVSPLPTPEPTATPFVSPLAAPARKARVEHAEPAWLSYWRWLLSR